MSVASDKADKAQDKQDKADAKADAKAAKDLKPIMSIADLAEWIRHVTKLGGGLDGTQVQQVLNVLDSYGGEPTKREQTFVQVPVPPGPPPAPPTVGPKG
jgi:hypothetical protein